MPRTVLALALGAALLASSEGRAATVSVRQSFSPPSPEAIAAGVPADMGIHDLYLTSDADVLAIDRVTVMPLSGSLFQVPPPFGADNEPPAPAFIALNRALEADSWMSTPGATTLLGPTLPGDGQFTTFGDLTNDGPQADFHFARLTFPGAFYGLRFRIQLAGATGPELFDFDLSWYPEPNSLVMAAVALVGLTAGDRRRRAGRAPIGGCAG
jgi:hypothetical protein